MTILDEIFANKQTEVARRKRIKPLAALRTEAEQTRLPVNFVRELRITNRRFGNVALIAEIKFASPSKGTLVSNPDPIGLARQYKSGGATAISVLTDEKYFRGKLDYLCQVHAEFPTVPLLRKDFICDPYQVYEARSAGASAVLLIAAHLDPVVLTDLHALVLELGMVPLVEVHDRRELDSVATIKDLKLVGVNNRDLHTFRVDLNTCLSLRQQIPPGICCVAESGIHDREDVIRLSEAGVDAILVGEALVTAENIVDKMRQLIGQPGDRVLLREE
jgi:indole-3-glycerol phosphate synthase